MVKEKKKKSTNILLLSQSRANAHSANELIAVQSHPMERYTDVDQKYLNALNMGLWNHCKRKKGEGGRLYLLQHDWKVNRAAE